MLHDAVRSKEEAPISFRPMLTTIRFLRRTVRRLRVDNDMVFLGVAFRNLLDKFNIAVEITAPYAHWQHGRIERQWGTFVPMAQSMIRKATLPRSYWALAMAAAVHVGNRVHIGGAGGAPFTLTTGRRADLSSMRVFGCPAYVHVDKSQLRRLDDRAWKGVFVGCASESPAWLVYNSVTRRVVSSRNVVLDEAAVLSMGESNVEQCNDDEEDNIPHTMYSEEPDTPWGSRRYGSRCNIPGRWKMNGTCIRGRLHVQGIIFDPLPHHSNAYPVQGIISVQRELWEMDELREIPQLLSQPATRLFKNLCHTNKR
jgi:hypothetical protein